MVEREITPLLVKLFQQYPFVTVTGPRQSGKTTLCRAAFPHLAYVNLEAPDLREYAESDPRGFLAQLDGGAILDEIQRVPHLLSYLQVLADEKRRNSLFVLTGSEQFRLADVIGQSLAGRTALLRLLPFTLAERSLTATSSKLDDILFSGFYPRIHDQNLDPQQALGDYFQTYVERDVRQVAEIRNLSSFQRFIRLCAGRVGQLLNLSSLGSDAGVSHTTVREWLSVLEAGYIIFQLQPYHSNVHKRLVKSPKLYFYDVGLASYLLGIESAKQIATHPLRGFLFENAVVVEALKHSFNRGREPRMSFFRDARGLECDLFYETGQGIGAFEAKSGATVAADFFASLDRVAQRIPRVTKKVVVYGGAQRQQRRDCEVIPLADVSGALSRFETERDIAEFVARRTTARPENSDIEKLDDVYRQLIQPILAGLESSFVPLGNSLFAGFCGSFTIEYGRQRAQIGGLLNAFTWQQARLRHILREGFALSERRPLCLTHHYAFQHYTGTGRKDFGLGVGVTWRLGSRNVAQSATVGGERIPEVEAHVPYEELGGGAARADHTIARLTQRVLQEIERLAT